MAYFRIKEPKPNNVKSIANTYSARKGHGVEVFYNIKKGKLFLADYYQNFSDEKHRKIPSVYNGLRMESMTVEYIMQEIEKAVQHEKDFRLAEKAEKKEQLRKYKEQRKRYRLKKAKAKNQESQEPEEPESAE